MHFFNIKNVWFINKFFFSLFLFKKMKWGKFKFLLEKKKDIKFLIRIFFEGLVQTIASKIPKQNFASSSLNLQD